MRRPTHRKQGHLDAVGDEEDSLELGEYKRPQQRVRPREARDAASCDDVRWWREGQGGTCIHAHEEREGERVGKSECKNERRREGGK